MRGWLESGGLDLDEALRRLEALSLAGVVVTDIDRDGTGAGPDLAGLEHVLGVDGAPGVASGGVAGASDLAELARLEAGGRRLDGSIVGRALLVGRALDRGGGSRMRAVRVIPCLDVDAGRVVKGVEFKGLRDAGDPVELAARYDAEGADELVLLDITASSDDRATMLQVVERAAEQVFIPLTVGGGVRSVADGRALLRAGADKVAVNSAAVVTPGLIAELADEFGGAVRRRGDRRPPDRLR